MIDDGDCAPIGGIKIGRGNRRTRRKPAPVSFCPTTNLTSPDRDSNPCRRGRKPATNLPSYGTASRFTYSRALNKFERKQEDESSEQLSNTCNHVTFRAKSVGKVNKQCSFAFNKYCFKDEMKEEFKLKGRKDKTAEKTY
jgi:hypothetical protein